MIQKLYCNPITKGNQTLDSSRTGAEKERTGSTAQSRKGSQHQRSQASFDTSTEVDLMFCLPRLLVKGWSCYSFRILSSVMRLCVCTRKRWKWWFSSLNIAYVAPLGLKLELCLMLGFFNLNFFPRRRVAAMLEQGRDWGQAWTLGELRMVATVGPLDWWSLFPY